LLTAHQPLAYLQTANDLTITAQHKLSPHLVTCPSAAHSLLKCGAPAVEVLKICMHMTMVAEQVDIQKQPFRLRLLQSHFP
jgi:hypothetical protein